MEILQTQTTNKFLTPEQSAELLQVSTRTMYEWLRNGEIPHERIGDRLIRIRESDILSPDVRTYFEQGCKLSHHPETVERAAEFFNKAIELNPRYMLAYFELGRMFYFWSHFSRAIEPLKKAIELNPSFSAYMYLGMNCLMGGIYHEAEKALEKAIELVPNDASSQFKLGQAKYMISINKYDKVKAKEALFHFGESLKIQSDHEDAANYIGRVLVLRLHELDSALAFANQVEQKLPEVSEYIRFLVQLNSR